MNCTNCGQDILKGTLHIPLSEIEMGDYKTKTCYAIKVVVKDE